MGTRNGLGDAVLFSTTTTGTGTYSVGAAVTGYFAPADASPSLDGVRVSYVAVDSLTAPTIREVGEGVLASGTPWTLTRATIRRSLTGGVAGSSAINWSAGTKYIFLTAIAANTPQFDTDGWLHTAGDLVFATNGTERFRINDDGTYDVAVPANLRTELEAAPLPISGTGVGQFTSIASATGAALALPSGGTWVWAITTLTPATNLIVGTSAGLNAGGTTIAAASPGNDHRGWAWRIA